MASKLHLKSNMRKAVREVHEGLDELIDEWQDVGLGTAQEKLTGQEGQRGYNLQELYDSLDAEKRGELNAAIVVGAWYAHFFEYGTVFISPLPFLRPAKRKADKTFRDHAARKIQSHVDRARI